MVAGSGGRRVRHSGGRQQGRLQTAREMRQTSFGWGGEINVKTKKNK